MKEFTVYNTGGEILRSGCCQEAGFNNQAREGEFILEGNFSADKYYILNDVPVAKSSKPSENYDWDETTKEWIPNLEKAIAIKKKEIDTFRDNIIYSNISYDGTIFQADLYTVQNIQKKLDELRSASALGVTPSPLIWRDYANVNHFWTDVAVFKTWLDNFVVLIATRTTSTIIAAFSHRDAVQLLTTVEDVEAYDITINWN